MCLILLRRLLTASYEEFWPKFTADQQAAFTSDLLAQASDCTDATLRKRLADCIAEVARYMLDEESGTQRWTQVCQFVPAAAQADDTGLKLVAMTIFE